MKTIVLSILAGLIPMIEAAGTALEADTTHPDKVLIGEGIVYGGQLFQFLLDRLHGKAATPPAIPTSINPHA